jgi:hypothetical protein
MIRDIGNGDRSPQSKIYFTNDEQGRYIQMNYFNKQGNNWIENRIISNIIWTEWNGFTYCSAQIAGEEMVTPYKRTKIKQYNGYLPQYEENFLYQKCWDINDTKTNRDTIYPVIKGNVYLGSTWENIYNEYGDYVEWRNTAYSNPDESGEQNLSFYSALYHKYVYDATYGMIEDYLFQSVLNNGKIDTVFIDGIKYTEFAPVGIAELPPSAKQLAIVPNPASGAVTISASAEIEQLQIFDIVGRMVHSQTSASKEVFFDTGILAQGVYLVRALLRDGGVQTGKIIRN